MYFVLPRVFIHLPTIFMTPAAQKRSLFYEFFYKHYCACLFCARERKKLRVFRSIFHPLFLLRRQMRIIGIEDGKR